MGYIDFKKLFLLLEKNNVKQQFLIDNGLNRRTLYKMKRGETVTTETIALLCGLLKCQPHNIMEYINDGSAPNDATPEPAPDKKPEPKNKKSAADDPDAPENIFCNFKG